MIVREGLREGRKIIMLLFLIEEKQLEPRKIMITISPIIWMILMQKQKKSKILWTNLIKIYPAMILRLKKS